LTESRFTNKMGSMPPTERSERRAGPRYAAPALEKGLDILELLSLRDEGLSQRQLADALERSVGEIYRMLACLVERGYVALEKPGDRYHLGTKLFELAHRHPPVQRLLAVALPVLREVARDLDQSCHLVVPHHGRGVVVAQEDCPGSLSFAVRMGTEVASMDSASGRVLLAFREERERLDLVGHGKAERERLTALEGLLADVRRTGCAEMESARVRGIRDTSYPIQDREGHAVAALTVPFVERLDLDPPFDRERVRRVLGAAAARISHALGSPRSEDR